MRLKTVGFWIKKNKILGIYKMKIVRKFFACVLFIASFGVFVQAQGSAVSKLKEVKVYFHFIGSEGTQSKIIPLKRKVSAKAPLLPAIEAMLKKPTKAEQKRGYQSAGYGDMKLISVKLKRGGARIDFSRTISDDYNPGDLETLSFENAVIKTAKQFPSVKKVVVCVNGMNEFGVGMVIDAPVPCPKEK
jgi:spore germination protein GerM